MTAKVMIVDDSAYARRVHRGMLEQSGHTVIEAGTGTSAIEMFSLERPDVVLLDLSMADIGGIEVETAIAGSGPPLLFLHGGDYVAQNRAFLDRLSGHFRVVAPRHPGFGETPRPAWFRSVHDIAYLYLDLLDRLDLKETLLVGHSFGGWVALEIAKAGEAASVCCLSPAGLWRRPLGARSFDSRSLGRRLHFLLPSLESHISSADEIAAHEQIAAAIAAGNEKEAARVMRDHLATTHRILVEAFAFPRRVAGV